MGNNKGQLRHAWHKAVLGLIVAAGAATNAMAEMPPLPSVIQEPNPSTCAIRFPDEATKQGAKVTPVYSDFKIACSPGFQLKQPIYPYIKTPVMRDTR